MNKKNVISILLALLFLPSLAPAIYDWQPLQQNNFFHAITNYGVLGQVKGGSDGYGFWPAPAIDVNGDLIPPLMNYVYGWGLWVGAQTKSVRPGMTRDTMVTIGYNPNNSTGEYTPGAVIGGVAQDPADAGVKVYISTEADWPLKKFNGEDSIISMCDTRCVYNDYNALQHAAGGVPLKIEVTQTTYQWNVPSLQDVIYFLFEVRNTGTDTLFDVYLAPTVDCDIGNESGTAANDVCYFDTTTNMAYQYQTSNYENGWSREPGCVGYTFLQGPVATKNYTFPDARQIFLGDTLGLTHFKVFNINIDPPTNLEQYKELAGYDYQTGTYAAFDPKPASGDQRFMESTGPIDIAPGQTAKVIVCLICANFNYTYMNINDTLAIQDLRQKAIDAKAVFNSAIMGQTTIALFAPVTGSVISGTQTISWTYGGNALATDSVDLYYSTDGYAWDSLSFNRPNNGSYSWNTANGPDGVRYKISAILHGPQKLASSVTGTFIVNNTGNAVPEMSLMGPDSAISGNYNWRWLAGDADQDEIFTSHYVMREGTGAWQKVIGMISSSPNNTQLWQEYGYTWNTDTMFNANYQLKTVCYDGQVTTADSTGYYTLYNSRIQYPGAVTGHSVMPVKWYTYNSGLITGHSYEARFKPIVRGALNSTSGTYAASYKYDLWDMGTASIVSPEWTVPYGGDYTAYMYYKDVTGQPYSGFAVLCGDTTFKPSLGVFDSVVRPVADPSVDTLYWLSITTPNLGWAKLNSDLEIRWHVTGTYPSDTLWPDVWDVTYNVQIPYDSTGLNTITTLSWNLGGTGTVQGRRYIVNVSNLYRKFMNVCGMRFYFKNPAHTATGIDMTWATHPQEGDIWRIYSSGPIPPREGDVYSFTPTGVEGAPSEITATSLLLWQNAPNPFKQLTMINYQLAKPGLVNLKVYNIAGQLVKTLVSGQASAGPHSVKWDGRDNSGNKVSSGIYIYRLQAGNKDMTRKLVVLR